MKQNWGTWNLFGGDFFSAMAKHSALDEAQEKVEHLQVQLRRFKTELADVLNRLSEMRSGAEEEQQRIKEQLNALIVKTKL